MANSFKSIREKNGLTQKELADLVGVDEGIIKEAEAGKQVLMSTETVAKIAEVFKEKPRILICDPVNAKPSKKSDEIWKGLPSAESEEKDKAFERDVLCTHLHGIETTLEIITDSLRNELAAMRDHFIGDMTGSCFNHIESLDYLHGEMSDAIAAFEKLIH